jgi:hypothetical protein
VNLAFLPAAANLSTAVPLTFDRMRSGRNGTEVRTMPAKSKAQQRAAGAALAAKRGDMKKRELKGASKEMEKSMTEDELEELAATRRKGKPEHVKGS